MHDASSIKKICSFFEKRKCARKIFIVFVRLSALDIKSRCNPYFLQNA